MAADDVDPPFLNPGLADGLVQLRGDVVEGDTCRSGGEGGREGRKEGMRKGSKEMRQRNQRISLSSSH